MQVISAEQKYIRPIVLCLGFFDCMHLGHVKLLKAAKKMAKNAQVALFTFSNNHFEVLKRPTKLIYTFDERLGVYQSLGVDVVVSAKFDQAFMCQKGEDFLGALKSNFQLKGIVCGADFTCGGDLLDCNGVKKFFEKVCPVKVVKLVKTFLGKQKICSTFVRQLLLENKVEKANGFLSQPFFFEGEVVHGRNVGQKLGFPTSNLTIPADKLAPQGVYLGMVKVQNTQYKAIVNVGNTPTFEVDSQMVEAHLLDFDGSLYGQKVKVSLLHYLRPIIKFENEQQLKEQLQKDILRWGD